MNKFARLMRDSGPARFFVPVGIILIVFAIILFSLNTGKYVETAGKITSVTEGAYDEEQNQQQYDLTVAYTVNGKDYTGTFNGLTGTFKTGNAIKVFYNPEDPAKITNAKMGSLIPIIMIAVGVLAIVFGLMKTIKAFKKSKELDATNPTADFDGFKRGSGVTEYYFRWDGNSLKPGYLIEDADRKPLFEGKMLKNTLVGARTFEFTNHVTGEVKEHDVGHTVTQTYNNSFFGAKSWFKFDGENIWDLLHERGLRMNASMFSKFPNMCYDVSKDGVPFAQFESTSMYVHEDEEAEHTIKVPVGRMYYRCWTVSNDFETLFLMMFATSETQQAMVE